MKLINKFILIIFISINYCIAASAADNLFEKAKIKFEKKDYEKSKFLFQRNIVFNPKNAESYLYLAKIFNTEEIKRRKKKI